MSEQILNEAVSSLGLNTRWLLVSLGERQSGVRLSALVRVLERAELFSVPLLPRVFKGIIYHNERAVPILNWKTFGIELFLNPLILILAQGKDWLGIEVEATGKVEEYGWRAGFKKDGFWIELDEDKGIWGIDEEKLFQSLRESPGGV